MIWWIVSGYLVFGLLLMHYMCPLWPFFEKLIGAVIWPISLVIGIRSMMRETRSGDPEQDLLILAMLMVARLEIEKNAERRWTPDQN